MLVNRFARIQVDCRKINCAIHHTVSSAIVCGNKFALDPAHSPTRDHPERTGAMKVFEGLYVAYTVNQYVFVVLMHFYCVSKCPNIYTI